MFNKENTYVINLEKRVDRLQTISDELALNIEISIFKAFEKKMMER